MRIQANTCSAGQGPQWLVQAWSIFKRQPLQLMSVTVFTMLLLVFMVMVPFIGIFLFLLVPGFTLMSVVAARTVASNLPLIPYSTFGIWREPNNAKPLIQLGAIYAVAVIVLTIAVLSMYTDVMQQLAQTAKSRKITQADMAPLESAALYIAIGYIPIAAAFWFSPMLVGLHRVKVLKALFFSWVACWRNLIPFVLFGAMLAGIMFGANWALVQLSKVVGLSSAVFGFIQAPLSLVLMSLLFCANYASYESVIKVEEDAPPANDFSATPPAPPPATNSTPDAS